MIPERATSQLAAGLRAVDPGGAADILQPDMTTCRGAVRGAPDLAGGVRPRDPRGPARLEHGGRCRRGPAAHGLDVEREVPRVLAPGPLRERVLRTPLVLDEAGLVPVPDRPGLGIEIDLEAVRACGCGAEDFGG